MTPRFSLVVRPLARQDIREAAFWYAERAEGLGDRFIAAVAAVMQAISEAPQRYPRVYGDARRVLVPDFPYAIYFAVRDEMVHVLACMHGRRDPRRWQARIRDLER